MAQNIYDRPEFFAGYSSLVRSKEGLAGAPEWPSLRAMLPGVRGRRVVDLGCGFGWFCRWAHEQGAASVLGLDVSQKMLERAVEASDPAIEYRRADLEELHLPAVAYEIAYSSLALHYVQDVARLFSIVYEALAPGGAFVFSTEHPVLMAPSNPGWMIDADGKKTWPLDRYFIEGQRTTDWLWKGVVKYHRTIGTTLNALIGAGFTLTHVEEFCPTAEQIAARPELVEELERPMFLLVSANK